MINVNQITAQLARMPDQALQQYAQMNKSDPYILSLALSESNRRKQMREGAQMSVPEQPKVVDQALADMAAPMPEDVGIAQLPTGPMEYAAGGIVAFDEGGEVPRYQAGGTLHAALTSYLKGTGQLAAYVNGTPAQRAAIEAAFHSTVGLEGPPRPTPTPGAAATPTQTATTVARSALPRALAASGVAGVAAIPASIAGGLTSAMDYMREQGYPVDTTAPEFATEPTPQQLLFDDQRRRRLITEMPQEERLRKFGTNDVEQALRGGAFATPAAAAAQPGAQPGAKPGAKPEGQPAPRREPGPGAATAPQAGLPTIAAMQSPSQMYQSALEAVPLVDPAAGLRDELGRELVGGAERRLAGRRAELEKEGDVFKGREERIGKREAALGKERESMTGLAFLEAGLAVMSTPGGLATALGKGARVGTERFAAGLDKIRAAQERLEDAKDGLETLRLNRSDMNAKEIRGLEADVDKAKTDAKKLGIDGLMQASDLRYKQAGELFKVIGEQEKTRYLVAGDLAGRQMSADATVRAAQIAAAQRGERSEGDLREIYAKSAVLQARYPNINDYLRMMKGTAALQSGQQLSPDDAALVNKYLR